MDLPCKLRSDLKVISSQDIQGQWGPTFFVLFEPLSEVPHFGGGVRFYNTNFPLPDPFGLPVYYMLQLYDIDLGQLSIEEVEHHSSLSQQYAEKNFTKPAWPHAY